LSIPEVAIANPLQGNPVFVDVMDLLLGGSLRGSLTRTFVLVRRWNPSLRMLGRARDGRSQVGPMGKISGMTSSQFSKLVIQLLRFGVLCFPALDIYINSKLSKMLDFCFDVRFVASRLCLEWFLLFASV
jgi:hypothetical protein